jgi:transcriptional regulator
MYTPSHFAEPDIAKLHAFIRAHSFGTLVSQVDGAPFATHIPFYLDAKAGEYGTLYCHVARANKHWSALCTDRQALIIFRGPHAYVSPTWYQSAGVPTWNYLAVHAYGKVRVLQTRDELLGLLDTLVRVNEARSDKPYTMNPDAPEVATRLAHIVGMEIPVEALQGKFKLSQNRPREDHEPVIAHLRKRGDADDIQVAKLMEENLKGKS